MHKPPAGRIVPGSEQFSSGTWVAHKKAPREVAEARAPLFEKVIYRRGRNTAEPDLLPSRSRIAAEAVSRAAT